MIRAKCIPRPQNSYSCTRTIISVILSASLCMILAQQCRFLVVEGCLRVDPCTVAEFVSASADPRKTLVSNTQCRLRVEAHGTIVRPESLPSARVLTIKTAQNGFIHMNTSKIVTMGGELCSCHTRFVHRSTFSP